MAPSYKDPTVLESHRQPLDRALGKTKARIWEERERKGGGKKITQNGRSGIWCSVGPMTNQTVQHTRSAFDFYSSIPQPCSPSCLPPSSSLAWFAVSMLVLLPFPFCIFFSWCEMNIKALLGQLGGLKQNLIGLCGPPSMQQPPFSSSSCPNPTINHRDGDGEGGDEASLQGGTPGRVRGNLRKPAPRCETKILLYILLWVR